MSRAMGKGFDNLFVTLIIHCWNSQSHMYSHTLLSESWAGLCDTVSEHDSELRLIQAYTHSIQPPPPTPRGNWTAVLLILMCPTQRDICLFSAASQWLQTPPYSVFFSVLGRMKRDETTQNWQDRPLETLITWSLTELRFGFRTDFTFFFRNSTHYFLTYIVYILIYALYTNKKYNVTITTSSWKRPYSFLNSATPYSDTMAALNDKFGQPHHIALNRTASVMDLLGVHQGDTAAFEKFALQVRSSVGILKTLGTEGEAELKCGSHVVCLQSNLPSVQTYFATQTWFTLRWLWWLQYEAGCHHYDLTSIFPFYGSKYSSAPQVPRLRNKVKQSHTALTVETISTIFASVLPYRSCLKTNCPNGYRLAANALALRDKVVQQAGQPFWEQ